MRPGVGMEREEKLNFAEPVWSFLKWRWGKVHHHRLVYLFTVQALCMPGL